MDGPGEQVATKTRVSRRCQKEKGDQFALFLGEKGREKNAIRQNVDVKRHTNRINPKNGTPPPIPIGLRGIINKE